MSTTTTTSGLVLLGRALLAYIFITAGFSKFGDLAGTMAYTASGGLPGIFGVLAAALEVIGGIAVLVGFQTRWAALALAAFSIAAGYLYHYVPSLALTGMEQFVQQTMFWKNVSIAGGFLVLAAFGPGALSVDARQGRAVVA
jgi:putative oxidoreductase